MATQRRRVLHGLTDRERAIAVNLLSEFTGWDTAGCRTLRSYARSCERLEALEATGGPNLYEELRANFALLKALSLDRSSDDGPAPEAT